ncbi:SH3 domain-containing protein [Enterovirga sp. CN4-39]|uniref:SH3 domain-containing protein n=1 Tax=Enterovirga sp. CN4-39 TaxID=3400910 RepID=UPI003BFB77C0
MARRGGAWPLLLILLPLGWCVSDKKAPGNGAHLQPSVTFTASSANSSPSWAPVYAPAALPSATSAAPSAAAYEPTARTVYVRGKDVPLRSEPRKNGPILDRFSDGEAIGEIERKDGWVRVRHPLTVREGWIDARRLQDTAPPAQKRSGEPVKEIATPSGSAVATAAIAALLIRQSLASYPGSCACPYSRDRAGRSCGRRSAYSKPKGRSPLCYESDVTPAMIDAHRSRQARGGAMR